MKHESLWSLEKQTKNTFYLLILNLHLINIVHNHVHTLAITLFH